MEPRSDHLKDSGQSLGSGVFFMPPSLVKANDVKQRGLKQTPHFLRFPRCRLLVFVAACLLVSETTNAADDGDFFRREVAPTFERRCLRCHNETDHKGGLSLTNASGLQAGGDSGAIIDVKRPEASVLLSMITGDKPEMPKGGEPL